MNPAKPPLATFYTLVTTQTLSLIGSRMTTIGVGVWVFAHTGLTSPLLLAALFNELPGMLFGSLSGVYVDRWDRRRVLILADLGQALGSLLLLLSFVSGRFQLWHLYMVALLSGTFATLQGPAEEAVTTLLVPEPQRERLNAVGQMAFPLAGVLAPALTGALYPWIGVTGIISMDLLTFLGAVVVLKVIAIPQPPPSEAGQAGGGSLLGEWSAGLRFLVQRRGLLSFVLYLTLINFLLNGPLELAVPYLLRVTGSEAQMGGLMGLMSLGALSGAGLMAAWGGTRPRLHTLLPGLFFSGLMFLLYGTLRSPLLLGASLVLLMIPLPVMNALYISIMQVKTPLDLQGRLFALVSQLGYLGSTTSFLLTGLLVDRWLEPAVGAPGWGRFAWLVGDRPGAGMGLLLVLVGLLILSLTLLAWLNPRLRRLEAELPDFPSVGGQDHRG